MPTRDESIHVHSGCTQLDVDLTFGCDAAGRLLDPHRVGTLTDDGSGLCFAYHPDFLARPLPVSPIRAPVRSGAIVHDNAAFDGVPGLLADSLPDWWGRAVQDRALLESMRAPVRPLGTLDRLAALGRDGMGAITFRSPVEATEQGTGTFVAVDLAAISGQARRLVGGSDKPLLPALRSAGVPAGGAQPKLVAALRQGMGGEFDLLAQDAARSASQIDQALPPGYVHCLVKLNLGAKSTRFGRESGAVEAAYAAMAGRAQIEMPPTLLIEDGDGVRHFVVERFDRFGAGGIGRLHLHSASGLLHASHRLPSLDYRTLLLLGKRLTHSPATAVEGLRRAAFNVFAHNRDDHARNFAFVMDAAGAWRMSPAYDLMFSDGINGHHSTSVADETLAPTRRHLERLGAECDLDTSDVRIVIEQVIDAVGEWPAIAQSLGIGASVRRDLERIFSSHR